MVQGPGSLAGMAVAEPALDGGRSAAVSLAQLSARDQTQQGANLSGFGLAKQHVTSMLIRALTELPGQQTVRWSGHLRKTGSLEGHARSARSVAVPCVSTGAFSLTASGAGHCPCVTWDLGRDARSRSAIEHCAA